MTLMQAIILGIVEGITEFLPISSTGHLILASRLLGLSQTDFQKSFEIAIQLGAIASVIVLYWRRFLELAVVSRVLVASSDRSNRLRPISRCERPTSSTAMLWCCGRLG
jgi:undecaprenyl-diphosphatase